MPLSTLVVHHIHTWFLLEVLDNTDNNFTARGGNCTITFLTLQRYLMGHLNTCPLSATWSTPEVILSTVVV